jgi:hypothetical protein
LKTVVQNRLQMFALNAEVVFSEVDNQKKSIEEALMLAISIQLPLLINNLINIIRQLPLQKTLRIFATHF